METLKTRLDVKNINKDQYDGVIMLVPEDWCYNNYLLPEFIIEFNKWNEMFEHKIISVLCITEHDTYRLLDAIERFPDSIAILLVQNEINQELDECLEMTEKDVFYISNLWDRLNH